jgi:quinol monooxygenase YgiN
MLVVAGTMEIDPEQRAAFLAGREQAVMAVRTEPGCLDYVFSADAYDPALVRLFERWENKEALAAHLAAMSTGGQSGGGPSPVRGVDILQYTISEVGPLGS